MISTSLKMYFIFKTLSDKRSIDSQHFHFRVKVLMIFKNQQICCWLDASIAKNLNKMSTFYLIYLYLILFLINFETIVGVKLYKLDNLKKSPDFDTSSYKKSKKPSSPKATFLSELLIFDRVFYKFPFGFYNRYKPYNSTKKVSYII